MHQSQQSISPSITNHINLEFRFVLVRPQMGENIGAVARVMSNFGLTSLAIVNPRDGWPNPRATAMAAHGNAVLERAEICMTLPSAIQDMHYVIATSANHRHMRKTVYQPDELLPKLVEEWRQRQNSAASAKTKGPSSLRIALVFGCESSGLNNDELALCDCLATIPSHPDNPSLNLGQAAGIIAYTLRNVEQSTSTILEPGMVPPLPSHESIVTPPNDPNLSEEVHAPVTHQDIDFFITKLEGILRQRHQLPASLAAEPSINGTAADIARRLSRLPEKLRNILLRAQLDRSELGLLHWIVQQKDINHH